jgi:hypothetical protein
MQKELPNDDPPASGGTIAHCRRKRAPRSAKKERMQRANNKGNEKQSHALSVIDAIPKRTSEIFVAKCEVYENDYD